MSAFLDSNLLVYVADQRDSDKHRIASEILSKQVRYDWQSAIVDFFAGRVCALFGGGVNAVAVAVRRRVDL